MYQVYCSFHHIFQAQVLFQLQIYMYILKIIKDASLFVPVW